MANADVQGYGVDLKVSMADSKYTFASDREEINIKLRKKD